MIVVHSFGFILVFLLHKSAGASISHDYGKYLQDVNENDATNNDLSAKYYLPKMDEREDRAGSSLLSKLSDGEVIRQLNKQRRRTVNEPHNKEEDELDFEIKTNSQFYDAKSDDLNGNRRDSNLENDDVNKEDESLPSEHRPFYRLPNKEVNTENLKPNYEAFQKLSKVLNERSKTVLDDVKNDINAKELLYEMLVSEIKALCCNKPNDVIEPDHITDNNNNGNNEKVSAPHPKSNILKFVHTEVMFVVVNDDITNSNVSDKVLYVDPNSLSSNSSVMILGQIKKHLTDHQLLTSMTAVTNELAKPEYLPLLNKIAEGGDEELNNGDFKHIVPSPLTRRYIKPHRCNHQSKLARVYGGPKWVVCSGYLNINTPSLYD